MLYLSKLNFQRAKTTRTQKYGMNMCQKCVHVFNDETKGGDTDSIQRILKNLLGVWENNNGTRFLG